ncbi:MAG: tRNA (adenosine(37)-N6)-threonylcarbamoyltransferase complex dimerization subunit type 1 TsaB [Sphingobacteriaceae bacterium]|nr:MAG: tRNA (adenosine(37)-N6)-threonylcarbamoyltransferase complex dimerization subunit type 1 TsaB [Pedobacter sp.]
MNALKNLILLIETATSSCSVALAENRLILAKKELNKQNIHASHITLFIDQIMHQTSKDYTDLNAIAVSQGPGSYTGLRIGVATAKGLCFALDIPLIAINTLKAMTTGLLQKMSITNDKTLFCPMIDARRMEVYTALFNQNLLEIEQTQAKILDETSFNNYLSKHPIIFFGDGAEKCKTLYAHKPNALFVDFENSASHLNILADHQFKTGAIEDLAYFEPYYLKDFIPNKLL